MVILDVWNLQVYKNFITLTIKRWPRAWLVRYFWFAELIEKIGFFRKINITSKWSVECEKLKYMTLTQSDGVKQYS